MRLALVSLKGGVGKSTSSVFLAAELAKRGRTLLIDTDPQGSTLAWSGSGEFPFPVVSLPVDDLWKRMPELSHGYEHVVVDTPPGEVKIVRGVVRAVERVLVPLGHTLVEIDRLRPTIELLAEVSDLNEFEVNLLLTRVKRRTNSSRAAREYLAEHLELPLLETEVPDWQRYALAFGDPLAPSEEYGNVVKELLGEEVPKHQPTGLEGTPMADDTGETGETGETADTGNADDGAARDDVKHDGHEALDAETAGRSGLLTEELPQAPLATPAPEEHGLHTHALPSEELQQDGVELGLAQPLSLEDVEQATPAEAAAIVAQEDRHTSLHDLLERDERDDDADDASDDGDGGLLVHDSEPQDVGPFAGAPAEAPLPAHESEPADAAAAPAPAWQAYASRDPRCLPYHYWQVDYEQAELGPDGEQRYLHRCINCELEVMARDVDAASGVAERLEALARQAQPAGAAGAATQPATKPGALAAEEA